MVRLARTPCLRNTASAVGEVKQQTLSDQMNTQERADYALVRNVFSVMETIEFYIYFNRDTVVLPKP